MNHPVSDESQYASQNMPLYIEHSPRLNHHPCPTSTAIMWLVISTCCSFGHVLLILNWNHRNRLFLHAAFMNDFLAWLKMYLDSGTFSTSYLLFTTILTKLNSHHLSHLTSSVSIKHAFHLPRLLVLQFSLKVTITHSLTPRCISSWHNNINIEIATYHRQLIYALKIGVHLQCLLLFPPNCPPTSIGSNLLEKTTDVVIKAAKMGDLVLVSPL